MVSGYEMGKITALSRFCRISGCETKHKTCHYGKLICIRKAYRPIMFCLPKQEDKKPDSNRWARPSEREWTGTHFNHTCAHIIINKVDKISIKSFGFVF